MSASYKAKLLRVFVSSTYEDMMDYRQAVIDELHSMEILARGMEMFVSSSESTLSTVLAEVRRCNIFVTLVGMRYGSVDLDTGKSYSELEYEEAIKNGIPVLAFVIDESECPIIPKYVDVGEVAEKLKDFKNKLDVQYTSRFKSIDHLKDLVNRSVTKQIEKINNSTVPIDEASIGSDYKSGAAYYRKFLIMPDRYAGAEVFLRVRLSGKFNTWIVKDELFTSRGLNRAETLYVDDGTHVIGANVADVSKSGRCIDFFACGKAVDWIFDNGITEGTIFDGKFKLTYDPISNISSGDRIIKVAAAILVEGISVISTDEAYLRNIRIRDLEEE